MKDRARMRFDRKLTFDIVCFESLLKLDKTLSDVRGVMPYYNRTYEYYKAIMIIEL